jgi:N-acetylmuramoyl-L-alanine amidase
MSKKLNVVMTRTTDVFITLGERGRISNNAGARVFCSIHLNAFNRQARGTETFYHTRSTASETLANRANDALIRAFGAPNRGVKQANFAVLRDTFENSLSILTETLFIDSPQDAAIIKQSDFIDKAAQAHADAILSVANDGDTVCIDPGHGGRDNGATGNGLREKDVVLQIGLRTRDILEGKARPSSGGSNSSSSSSSSTSFTNMSASQKYKEIESAFKDAGLSVEQGQRLLIGAGEQLPRFGADGKPGAETLAALEAFQTRHRLSSPQGDFFGRPGPRTIEELKKLVPYGGIRIGDNRPYPRGNDVRAVQRVLNVTADSIYGPQTAAAVRRYQQANGLSPDGRMGPITFGHMFYSVR